MYEKIYLGFAGKENLRLGESLDLIDEFVYVLKEYLDPLPIEKLQEYMSNPYMMYSIKDINTLINLFNYTTGTILLGIGQTTDYRKSKIEGQKEEEYIISFSTFKFFSEKIWNEILESFIKNIKQNKDSFILRLRFPFKVIEKLYNNECDYTKTFVDEFSKWIKFHFIGEISEIFNENQTLTISLNIKY